MRDLPVDRLKFEHEKRQHEISRLQRELSRLHQEVHEFEEWYEGEKERRSYSDALVRSFIEEGHSDAGIWQGIGNVESQMQGVQAEMDAIDQVLSQRWK